LFDGHLAHEFLPGPVDELIEVDGPIRCTRGRFTGADVLAWTGRNVSDRRNRRRSGLNQELARALHGGDLGALCRTDGKQ